MNTTTPENIGLSSERLARIDEHLLENYIEPRKISGAQILVARHGQIGHFSTRGETAFDSASPLRDDAIFRIYSMTKPITTVAAMMLYEGVGFGLGFSVNLGPARTGSVGSFGEYAWGGMASTVFWIDPVEDLIVIFMTQLIPSRTYEFRATLRSQVYASLLD